MKNSILEIEIEKVKGREDYKYYEYIIESLIAEICELESEVSSLNEDIWVLEDRIDDLREEYLDFRLGDDE